MGQKKRLELCEGHKQEWKQSHYAEHNCDYCKLEVKLAHLAARERSVQGWAIVSPDNGIEIETIGETEQHCWALALNGSRWDKHTYIANSHTCQPVIITINAAGQASDTGITPASIKSETKPDAPTAPAHAAPEVDSRSRLRRIAAQKGEPAPTFAAPVAESAYIAGVAAESERIGIRKGLEMAIADGLQHIAATQEQADFGNAMIRSLRALLDAQRESS